MSTHNMFLGRYKKNIGTFGMKKTFYLEPCIGIYFVISNDSVSGQ